MEKHPQSGNSENTITLAGGLRFTPRFLPKLYELGSVITCNLENTVAQALNTSPEI